MAKTKRWKDGKEFYTKGIAVLFQKHKGLTDAPKEPLEVQTEAVKEDELRKEQELEEACYVNRALCNLELSTHTRTLRRSWANPNIAQKIIDQPLSIVLLHCDSTQRMSRHTTALLPLCSHLISLQKPRMRVHEVSLLTPRTSR